MDTNLKPKHITKYFNKIDKKNDEKIGFLKTIINDYDYLIPQFYLKQNSYIKSYHNITLQLNLFNTKYKNLKKILELNINTLKIPSNKLKLDLSKDENIIYQNLNKKYKNMTDVNLTKKVSTDTSDFKDLLKNKNIFQNFKNYREKKYIYSNIESSLFIKILNENLHKDKVIFIKMYKNLIKHLNSILKYKYSTGILGYDPIFNIGNLKDSKNNNINKDKKDNNNKYVLINKNSSNNGNNSSNNENNSSNNGNNSPNNSSTIENALNDYTELYESYNCSKFLIKIKNKLEEHCKKFHDISLKLSEKSYTNIYDLLILILDQEYHLLNFMLHFNYLSSYEKILKKDIEIRQYVKRNLMNFSSYMDDYLKKDSNNVDNNMFEIQSYDINKFFSQNE